MREHRKRVLLALLQLDVCRVEAEQRHKGERDECAVVELTLPVRHRTLVLQTAAEEVRREEGDFLEREVERWGRDGDAGHAQSETFRGSRFLEDLLVDRLAVVAESRQYEVVKDALRVNLPMSLTSRKREEKERKRTGIHDAGEPLNLFSDRFAPIVAATPGPPPNSSYMPSFADLLSSGVNARKVNEFDPAPQTRLCGLPDLLECGG